MEDVSDSQAPPFLVAGRVIHFTRDDHGRILVIDDGNQRILNFDSLFEQSCMQLTQPFQLVHHYTQLMALVLTFIDPSHITLFGLGGGSLLRTFHHLLPTCHFNVVELRKIVVDTARDYFSLPLDQRVSITINDVFKAIVQIESNSSDIIFSDIYDAYEMAPQQLQKKFLFECSRVLTDRGWLVLNLHHLPDDRSTFFEMLGTIFPTIMQGKTEDNVVLLLSNAPLGEIKPIPLRIETMEKQLQQRFSQLMPMLRPLNCRPV